MKTALKRQDWLIRRIEQDRRREWNYVVLQSWQDIVDDPDAGYAAYVKKWVELIREVGAEPILYITAPHAQNAEQVDGPVEVGQTEREMRAIRRLIEKVRPYAVVPVPLAIQAVQEGGTNLTFRYVNDFHPNQTTAFLTANMFYAALSGKSPEGLNFNTVTETNDKGAGAGKDPDGGEATVEFDEATKVYLQKIAYESIKLLESIE